MSGWAASSALSDVYVYHARSQAHESTSMLLLSEPEPTPSHDRIDGRNHESLSGAVTCSNKQPLSKYCKNLKKKIQQRDPDIIDHNF